MALAVEGTPTKTFGSAASSLTWSHTCGGDGLFVGAAIFADPARTASSVTFNGDALTELWDFIDTFWGNCTNTGYLMCAPDAATANVVVTFSAAGDNLAAGAVGLSGLATPVASAHRTAYKNDNGKTVTVVDSVSADLVIDCFFSYGTVISAGAGQTSRCEYDNFDGSGWSFGISSEGATGANTVMDWTSNSGGPDCIGATALIPAAEGGGRTTKNNRAKPLGYCSTAGTGLGMQY